MMLGLLAKFDLWGGGRGTQLGLIGLGFTTLDSNSSISRFVTSGLLAARCKKYVWNVKRDMVIYASASSCLHISSSTALGLILTDGIFHFERVV